MTERTTQQDESWSRAFHTVEDDAWTTACEFSRLRRLLVDAHQAWRFPKEGAEPDMAAIRAILREAWDLEFGLSGDAQAVAEVSEALGFDFASEDFGA